MTPAVVDTDVVSFLFKNDSRAQLYLPLMRNRDLLVSFMTEAELEQWILLAKWGVDRVRRFRNFMTGFASVPSSRDLPIDDDIIWRLFGDEVQAGDIPHPMSITDVWKNSYSENTSRKVWAAKYVARHPNLVALELSSFKCGHNAPGARHESDGIADSEGLRGNPYVAVRTDAAPARQGARQ
jgi:predicted nucleic acid-binding protein